jgi:hypothetical protein
MVDPAAFEPLYRRYLDPVFRYCDGRLGSRVVVEISGRTPESVRTLQLRAIRGLQSLLSVPESGSTREVLAFGADLAPTAGESRLWVGVPFNGAGTPVPATLTLR